MDSQPSAATAVRIAAIALIIVVTGLFVTLYGVYTTRSVATSARRLGIDNHSILARFDDCTTPGPNPPPTTGHPCYDLGIRIRTEQVESLRHSLNCLYLIDKDDADAKCDDVRARVDALRAKP